MGSLPADASAQAAPFTSHRLPIDTVSYRDVIGDVDEDGHLDVLTAAGGKQILFGAGDLHEDGDGYQDVVAASTGGHSVVMRRGHSDGSFDALVTQFTWFSPIDLLTVDWNGDGKRDLTTFLNASGTTVEVRLGTGGLALAPPIQRDLGGACQRATGHGRPGRSGGLLGLGPGGRAPQHRQPVAQFGPRTGRQHRHPAPTRHR